MKTPNDDTGQGSKTGYLTQPQAWRPLDPEVFDYLREQFIDNGIRNFSVMQSGGPIKECNFFSNLVPEYRSSFSDFLSKCLQVARGSSMLFFDPDVGIHRKGVRSWESNKYVLREELIRAFAAGHSLLIYQHLPYGDRDNFIERRANELREQLETQKLGYLRAKEIAFYVAIQSEHARVIELAGHRIASCWAHSPFQVLTNGL